MLLVYIALFLAAFAIIKIRIMIRKIGLEVSSASTVVHLVFIITFSISNAATFISFYEA
jgi:hypothetical protein